MKFFGKGAAFEWAGIPCIIWIGVVCLVLNHIVYPVIGSFLVFIKPVPLPKEYWTALGWIICGLFGKKVGDKYMTRRTRQEDEGFGDRNKPQD